MAFINRLFRLLLLTSVIAAASTIGYFIWWDSTHCVFCRSRLDKSGRCVNTACNLGRLTREKDTATAT